MMSKFMRRLDEALRGINLSHTIFDIPEELPDHLKSEVLALGDMTVTVEYEILPGEPRTWEYPGSGPTFNFFRVIGPDGRPIDLPDEVEEWMSEKILERTAHTN